MNLLDQIQAEISLQPLDSNPNPPDTYPAGLSELAPAIRMVLMQETRSILAFTVNNLLFDKLKNKADFLSLFDLCDEFPRLKDLVVPAYLTGNDIEQQGDNIKAMLLSRPGINIVGITGIGVVAWGASKQAAEQRISCMLDLLRLKQYCSLGHEVNRHVFADCLEQKYRKQLVSKPGTRELDGKIALVTGAAQGIGKGLAEILLHAGAHVALADINREIAAANSLILNQKYGDARSVAVGVDVRDGASVQQMIRETVAAYGGIDILVSNAGILRAGSLADMSAADFELSTRINYTGFFLCAKYASEVMKIQHQFQHGHYMDIIQVNSKSGLVGSSKNSAYAGSKFGGIGLTQSFALELVDYNIKVNAICPGNFFEGPLWSDPEKGLFVQYLNAGKVPGAATIDDVRYFYEAKVPMRRGCNIEDVGKALLYIIDQKYETGQALPVTGGQVMLR